MRGRPGGLLALPRPGTRAACAPWREDARVCFPSLRGWSSSVLERKQLKGRTQVTFILPEGYPGGPVSVVRDFNHWSPAGHT